MYKKFSLIPFVLSLLLHGNTSANNLQISNFQVSSTDTVEQYANVQFDITWENSWYDNTNWDAVWIFIKYRTTTDTGAWQHATLNSFGHTASSGSMINTVSDGKGIFLYRDSDGSGTVNYTGVQLRWNFGTDGLSSDSIVDVKVFGIEMVYVPQGNFYVGDGQTNNSELYANFESDTSGNTFQITSEDAITLGGGSIGSLGNNNRINQFTSDMSCSGCLPQSGDDFNDTDSQVLPTAFPKGYDAFYCMKYEITQQQFVDMLNCSSNIQQTLLADQTNFFIPFGETAASNRYGIDVDSNGLYYTTQVYLPMVYFDWIKTAAYADWAALRPMTELEFEKACRGLSTPVINEFAWGNANADLSNNLTLSDSSQATEGIASGYDSSGVNGNCWVNDGSQIMESLARVGIFAAHNSNSGRVSSGGTVYGIMEMSGNAWERVVSVGHPEGRKFTGIHGDGNISNNGYANVANWPGSFSNTEVNTNVGVGYRGGALAFPKPNLIRNARVSSRRLASGYWDAVIDDDGARLIRTVN